MAFPLYNVKFILLISASFITIFSSIAIYFCLPILISHIIRTQLSLSERSGSFDDWRFNSVVDRIYLYNITNLDEMLGDAAKNSLHLRPVPKLKQIGPFTFRQDREKLNIRFETSNETVIYDQQKRWTFMPELSVVGTLEDLNSTWINHMNVPLAGTTLTAEYAELVDAIVSEFDLKLFSSHSANALLFEGYFDILMEQAKHGGQVDVDRFGWMHNQNNSITRNIRIFTGSSNATLDKLGAVDEFGHLKRFNIWNMNGSAPKDASDDQCNEFRFSSAGELFPPPEHSIISYNHNTQNNLISNQNSFTNDKSRKDLSTAQLPSRTRNSDGELTDNQQATKTIYLFMPDLCRSFKLDYNNTFMYKRLLVNRYVADKSTYEYTEDSNNEQTAKNSNKCFCTFYANAKISSCPPNGMMDLYTCRKGSPLTISFPHFLHSDKDKTLAPYMKLFDDAVQPNMEDHLFYIDLESSLNIPVKAQIAIQFNVHYKDEPSLNFTRDYSFLVENRGEPNKPPLRDLYLPQMWFVSTGEIDKRNLNNLRFIQRHLALVTPISTIIIFAFASILLATSAKLAYDLAYGPKSRKTQLRTQDSCSSLDRAEGAFMDEKQKYYAMQLLDDGMSKKNDSVGKSGSVDRSYQPTTSKTIRASDESEPLNTSE